MFRQMLFAKIVPAIKKMDLLSILTRFDPALDEAELKAVRTVDKLGNYWRICSFLVRLARHSSFRPLFHATMPMLEALPPFATTQQGRVHAEIQLVVHYEVTQRHPDQKRSPRVFGVSKTACYLCDLFLKFHQHFHVWKTHGRLWPAWTVPDLQTYDPPTRKLFRTVLVKMVREMARSRAPANRRRSLGRHQPVESCVLLPQMLALNSSTSTFQPSAASVSTINAPIPTTSDHVKLVEPTVQEPVRSSSQSLQPLKLSSGSSSPDPSSSSSLAVGVYPTGEWTRVPPQSHTFCIRSASLELFFDPAPMTFCARSQTLSSASVSSQRERRSTGSQGSSEVTVDVGAMHDGEEKEVLLPLPSPCSLPPTPVSNPSPLGGDYSIVLRASPRRPRLDASSWTGNEGVDEQVEEVLISWS